jgi:hypothetical protein
MGSLTDLRDMHERLLAEGGSNLFPANHGVAWGIYAHDPEANNLEFFVDSEWYITQPFLIPLYLSKSDSEIVSETKQMCESSGVRSLCRLAQEDRRADDAVSAGWALVACRDKAARWTLLHADAAASIRLTANFGDCDGRH